jgi:hypothetical protein
MVPSLAPANMRLEIVDIVGSSPEIVDGLLQQLMVIFNNGAGFTCHGDTTHIVLLYRSGTVVGGGLLRVATTTVAIKRLCTNEREHPSIIIRFLQERYKEKELHANPERGIVDFYLEHNFTRKSRTRRCLCKYSIKLSHLVWRGVMLSSHVGSTRHPKGSTGVSGLPADNLQSPSTITKKRPIEAMSYTSEPSQIEIIVSFYQMRV